MEGIMRLTKKLIDASQYRPGKAKCVYWDDEIPAFGVRVYPTGKKAGRLGRQLESPG